MLVSSPTSVPRRARLLAGLCGLLLLSPFGARAQEAGRLLAVQQRKFNLTHELMVGGTFEPQDAFSKGLAPELAYIYHLDDAWSWEVLRGGYLAQLATGLRTQLERDFGVSPNALDSLQYYASSSMIPSILPAYSAAENIFCARSAAACPIRRRSTSEWKISISF